jgi:sugar/nucleoside kinase (ribokinase family)
MPGTVVALGHAAVDSFGLVARYTEPGNMRELRQFSLQGAGCAATAAATLAVLGVKPAFVGKVSDDGFGRQAVRSLETLGVDVAPVVVAPGYVTPFAYIAVEEGPTQPVIYYTRGNVPPLEPEEVDLALVDGAALLLVDGHQPRAQIAAAERARKADVPVLLVGGTARERLGDLIALADTIVCGERFATEVAPRGELEDSLGEIRAMGPKTVVITLGDVGAIGLEGDEVVRRAPFATRMIESTRARDVFAGAFAYGSMSGWSLERRMQFATVAAALSCRALGRRAALPELNETLLGCGWRP